MRRYHANAQKSMALLTIVGSIIGSMGIHGSSSSSPRPYSPLRVRSATSSMPATGREGCTRAESSASTSPENYSSPTPSPPSAATVAAACARGGAAGDDPRRRGDRDRRGDGPPARRPSPPRDRGREDGGREERSGPRPGGDSRGADRRGGGGGRRHGRHRDGADDFGGGSNGGGGFGGGGRDDYDAGGRRERDPGNYRSGGNDPDGGKSKKWFSFKKGEAKTSSNKGRADFDPRGDVPPVPPPPPPPPPTFASSADINPAETERTPIHYMFPTAEAAAEERKFSDKKFDNGMGTERGDREGNGMDAPYLDAREDEFADGDGSVGRRRRRRASGGEEERFRASPRRDAVTVFMSSRGGKFQVRLGSAIVGAALGGFVGKSLVNDPRTMSIAMSSFLLLTGFLRNDYGELSRALGIAFVLTLRRTRSVRKDYPTAPHLKAMIGQGPRKPFPPVEDGVGPWRYEPVYRDDPEFRMAYAVLAMALVGSFCGGNVPMLPAWMGGLVGAAAFASLTTGSNARGDLGRSMGMRVVGLVRLVLAINSELRILGKSATVGGLIFDKIMIMDSKHRIKDRIVAICKWGYEKVVPEQEEEEMEVERPERRR